VETEATARGQSAPLLDLSEAIDRWCKSDSRRHVELWGPDGDCVHARICDGKGNMWGGEGATYAEALGAAFAEWDARDGNGN
jgi:hypothetical protein